MWSVMVTAMVTAVVPLSQVAGEAVQVVGEVVRQVVERYLPGCHLVIVTENSHSPTFSGIIWSLGAGRHSRTVIDVRSLGVSLTRGDLGGPLEEDVGSRLVLGDSSLSCRALLLDLTRASSSDDVMTFLTEVRLPLWPRTRVVGVGPAVRARETLLHHTSLKNTRHGLYLATTTPSAPCQAAPEGATPAGECVGGVWVYARCLYCSKGRPGVRILGHWRPGQDFPSGQSPFPEEFEDMMGHQVRVVAKTLFPFMEFLPESDVPGTTVIPRDSLDVRMLNTVARILNFTYEMRMALDDQWGTQEGGNWTGMVGTLAQERADISMMLFWSFDRKQVIDFTRIYTSEPFIMITHKPRPKPQHLALVRPFEVELWLFILASIMAAGLVLWGMQRAWASFSGGRGLRLSTALMHAWGIMLEDPLVHLPSNVVGQMVVGWWWVFCMLVTALYRSSLIAHLSVPTTSPPIDHLDHLLALHGASWGIEPGFGLGWDWFKLNSNPKVQEMFKTLQVLSLEEQLEQVLKGRHAFFTWKYYIKTIIASRYTNHYGYTPIHVSRQEFIPGSTGWGVRKGLPFLEATDRLHDRLVEAGLVDLWLHELFETAMRETRAQMKTAGDAATAAVGGDASLLYSEFVDKRRRALVLSLNHLQGAFYLLLLGFAAAALALLLERAAFFVLRSPPQSRSPSQGRRL